MYETVYVWDKEKRQFLDFVPPLSIIIAGLVFLIGTGLAILKYEVAGQKYQFFDQFFSELGARADFIRENSDGTTEIIGASNVSEIFNFSLIIAGFLVIPFFPFTYRQMRNRSRLSRYFFLISILFGTMTGPLLIGVGLVDLSVENTSFIRDHHVWAAGLYLFISVASIFWLLGIAFSKDLPYHTTRWIFLDYFLVILLVIFVLVSLLDNLDIIPVEDIPLFNSFPIEAYQKFMAYIFFIYYGLIVGIRLTNTKYDNTPGISKIEIPE